MGTKISELPTADTYNGTEEIPLVQDATTKKIISSRLLTKSVFQIDLSSDNYSILSTGIYEITNGSDPFNPYFINLPNPSTSNGMELIFFNCDQTLNADFGGDYLPFKEGSTSNADKYNTIPNKRSVLVFAVNGYWRACNYRAS
jgi:hypothetical protein